MDKKCNYDLGFLYGKWFEEARTILSLLTGSTWSLSWMGNDITLMAPVRRTYRFKATTPPEDIRTEILARIKEMVNELEREANERKGSQA